MKKSLLKLAGAALLAFALTNAALAGPINGEINFTGFATMDGSAATATQVNSFGTVLVVSETSTGDYSGFPVWPGNSVATFTPFAFGAVGSTGALSVNPLWTVVYGGLTYSFELTSITINEITGSQRNIEGSGIATITGGSSSFDPTPGVWSMSTSGAQAKLSFSSATSVPDGGTTALLVGVALLGLGVISRRKAA